MYVARKSNHIQEDIKRNWSSWNFGMDGFEGTRDEFQELLDSATEERAIHISGWEIFPDQIKEYQFGELYENYFVAIDNVNAPDGLSCNYLDAESLEDAKKEAISRDDYCWDGDCFDAEKAELIYSEGDIHVFFIED